MTRTTRSAALVFGLLAFFFLLMSYQVNRARTLATARGAVTGLVSPFQRVAASATIGVRSAWNRYVGLLGSADESERLRQENAQLQRQLAAAATAQHENRRLRAMLRITKTAPGAWTAASVVGRDLAHRYQSLQLDRGSADGVGVDDAVISPEGALVGRVIQVSRWTSAVQLLTDALSGVGARLGESRASGLLAGADGPLLELRFIQTLDDVLVGETVETSGEDGIYPAGIPVGEVTRAGVGPALPGTPPVPLSRDETALFMQIEVQPRVDIMRLEDVLVLRRNPDS